jgi:toxoflavin synthase
LQRLPWLKGPVMTDYNVIAPVYRETKSLPIKQYSETFTFFQVLKSVCGLAVLDVACGDGYYTRAMKRQGASHVIGVDRSHMMITYAQREEEAHPLGIEYVVGDVETVDLLQTSP